MKTVTTINLGVNSSNSDKSQNANLESQYAVSLICVTAYSLPGVRLPIYFYGFSKVCAYLDRYYLGGKGVVLCRSCQNKLIATKTET